LHKRAGMLSLLRAAQASYKRFHELLQSRLHSGKQVCWHDALFQQLRFPSFKLGFHATIPFLKGPPLANAEKTS